MRKLHLLGRLFVLFAIALLATAGSTTAAPPAAQSTTKQNSSSAEKPSGTPDGRAFEKPSWIKQLPDGRIILPARDATVHGTKLRYESRKNTLGYWFNADDWVSWNFEITMPGKLIVDLTQSCGPESAGSHYTVEVDNQKLKDKVQETGSFRLFRPRRLGTLEFNQPGKYTLSVRALDKPRLAVMDLQAVMLTPLNFRKPAATKSAAKTPAAATTQPEGAHQKGAEKN